MECLKAIGRPPDKNLKYHCKVNFYLQSGICREPPVCRGVFSGNHILECDDDAKSGDRLPTRCKYIGRALARRVAAKFP